MANKISELDPATVPLAGSELVWVEQGGGPKRVAVGQLPLPAHGHSEYVALTGNQTIDGRKTFNAGIGVIREDNVYVTPVSFPYAAQWKFTQQAQLDNPPGTGSWAHVLTVQGWSQHNAAYPSYQMCFRNGAVSIRQSVDNSTWGDWKILATTDTTYSRAGAGGNITISVSDPSGGANGDIWFKV